MVRRRLRGEGQQDTRWRCCLVLVDNLGVEFLQRWVFGFIEFVVDGDLVVHDDLVQIIGQELDFLGLNQCQNVSMAGF